MLNKKKIEKHLARARSLRKTRDRLKHNDRVILLQRMRITDAKNDADKARNRLDKYSKVLGSQLSRVILKGQRDKLVDVIVEAVLEGMETVNYESKCDGSYVVGLYVPELNIQQRIDVRSLECFKSWPQELKDVPAKVINLDLHPRFNEP